MVPLGRRAKAADLVSPFLFLGKRELGEGAGKERKT